MLKLNNLSAGLTAKSIETEAGTIHYLEGGEGETILLIHGIYARKEHWVEMMRHLVSNYHVIAIDLPGFGNNARLPVGDYALDRQQVHLRSILDALDLAQVHIGANSMGAYVATLLAHQHPERVASIAFIGSPLGVSTPIQSDMDRALAIGHKPLVVRSEPDFAARHDWLTPKMPYVPGPILQSWMADEVSTADHNAQVWAAVHDQSSVPTVLELAPALAMPSLVIWCQPDRIFHVSGARVLGDALPASTRATPENCGHLPMLDQPTQVAEIYVHFLQSAALTTP
ncbi:alpha/beta hydrolase [Roseobacter fucihabitans]|uniref:alpha/beta fold hydrolase n=1 Tax=Roseobacter fucihabitans TaxID=1537242 RepID=UPI0030CF0B0A